MMRCNDEVGHDEHAGRCSDWAQLARRSLACKRPSPLKRSCGTHTHLGETAAAEQQPGGAHQQRRVYMHAVQQLTGGRVVVRDGHGCGGEHVAGQRVAQERVELHLCMYTAPPPHRQTGIQPMSWLVAVTDVMWVKQL